MRQAVLTNHMPPQTTTCSTVTVSGTVTGVVSTSKNFVNIRQGFLLRLHSPMRLFEKEIFKVTSQCFQDYIEVANQDFLKELNETFPSLLLGDMIVSIKSNTVTTEQENVLVSLKSRKSSPTTKYLESEMKIGKLHGQKYENMESSSAYPTFRKLHLAKPLNMTEKEMDNVEKDFAKAAGSVNTETEESSFKKQKVDKGESAESKEKAKHAMSEADAKTFRRFCPKSR